MHAFGFDQGFAPNLEGFKGARIDEFLQLGHANAESLTSFLAGKCQFGGHGFSIRQGLQLILQASAAEQLWRRIYGK